MPLYRDEGVVVRTTKLGEADRIVTLLTRSHGKIRAVAKGVRRVKSRFGGRLEPFMRVDVLIATGRTLDVVSQAESISAYAAPICADYGAYGIANVMVETADKLVSAEGERAVAQYRLLVGGLNALARHAHPATAIGESYVLRALGYRFGSALVGTGAIAGLTTVLLVMMYAQTRAFFSMSRISCMMRRFSSQA